MSMTKMTITGMTTTTLHQMIHRQPQQEMPPSSG
jgi:hypothetical protein